jgi:hypothetical protein
MNGFTQKGPVRPRRSPHFTPSISSTLRPGVRLRLLLEGWIRLKTSVLSSPGIARGAIQSGNSATLDQKCHTHFGISQELQSDDHQLHRMQSTNKLLKKSPSSSRWLQRQSQDPYVRLRTSANKDETYRSRSAFKLVSLYERHPSLLGRNKIELTSEPLREAGLKSLHIGERRS